MQNKLLLCPKCKEQLFRENGSYKCSQGHCYDIAKEGYVNLLLKHSVNPGDSTDSLQSRDRFLNKGYYKPLSDKLNQLADELLDEGQSFLDAGCGTGYYLQNIINHIDKKIDYYGTDISKKGVSMTAKKCPEATCFVGNVFHLPFGENSLNVLMSVFTPYSNEEFGRVVKKGGYVIAVTPGKRHLYQLKEIVYKTPYLNEESGYTLDDFQLISKCNVTYEVTLNSNEDLVSLWKMMPYYHTSRKEDNDRLLAMETAQTEIDFLVSLYRKQ